MMVIQLCSPEEGRFLLCPEQIYTWRYGEEFWWTKTISHQEVISRELYQARQSPGKCDRNVKGIFLHLFLC